LAETGEQRMTHNELLAEVNRRLQVALYNGDPQSIHALRAVVELHKPTGWFEDTGYADQECVYCDNGSYPCPTIQAIEKELG
jgi:carboxypeptidase C (cathepsin A)